MMNHNVKVSLVQIALLGAADSIWTGTVIAAFIYILSNNKNSVVGYIEAGNGLATLLFAFPVGYFADKYTRSLVISIGGVIAFVAIGLTSSTVYFAAEYDEKHNEDGTHDGWTIYVLGLSMVLWGISSGISSGPAQALYADSIPHGDRSKWYTYLYAVYLISSAVGPTTSVVIFKIYGDHWTLHELRNVMLAGMGLEAIASIPSFLYDDKYALGKENDVDGGNDIEGADTVDKNTTGGEKDQTKSSEKQPLLASVAPTRDEPKLATCLGVRKEHIPYVLFASDLVVAIGSGMTVKFFPLFFKNSLDMTPSAVQIVYIIAPVAIAMTSSVGTTVARRLGRIETILIVRGTGLGCLLAMSMALHQLDMYSVIALYIVRTGLMNCTYPLEESILMDSVPRSTRARWKSLESVSRFGWCGSAMVGGILSDHFDYSFTFMITVAVQGFGTLILLLILPVVPQESKLAHDKPDKDTDSVGHASESLQAPSSSEADPLLIN
eukprot:m.1031285 g.1031285  ORF g.1031285 m.1031285 type:complete len:494 (-) comp24122_c0_seq4:2937-4418(-)